MDPAPDPRLAVVLGGASSVWTDFARIERITGPWPGLVIAVNDVGCFWTRRLDHWVSLHPQKFSNPNGWRNPSGHGPNGWIALRERLGYSGGYGLWAHTSSRPNAPAAVQRVRQEWGGGSSGLLGIALAYRLGVARVILAGVPMDDRPHFLRSPVHNPKQKWTAVGSHTRPWERHLARIRERTRSMSGWTRELLGAPTPAFFDPDFESRFAIRVAA